MPTKSFLKIWLLCVDLSVSCAVIRPRDKFIKGKVFYGQEPPSGESPTTECGFNYQLLAVMD